MALISKIIRFIYFFCIINNMRQQIPAKLPLDIRPSDYNQKHSKQLGNHFIYAKLSNNQKWNDARLKVLQPSYFLGRSVLDIGCNQGILAIPIAIKFQPKLVKGIDIDIEMTKKAKTNIETFKSKAMSHNYPKQIISQISTLPRYFKQKISKIFGETVLQLSNNHEIRPKDIKPQNLFPTNIQIINDNIFSYRDVDKFDCVLCMNMTKWIHLAFGDEGIKQLFMQVQRISNDGAIFVLESHPWSSYRKKKNMFDSYKYNYRMILLKPDRFKDLLQKLGFELIETISPSADNGLKHEILVFQKKSSLKSKDYF